MQMQPPRLQTQQLGWPMAETCCGAVSSCWRGADGATGPANDVDDGAALREGDGADGALDDGGHGVDDDADGGQAH